MKLNFNPSSVAFLDFEVQSAASLDKGPFKAYLEHPTTAALTCAVSVDGKMHRFSGGFERLAELTEDRVIVAHNAPYDAGVWSTVLKLPEREWFDTLPCARAAGLPGGLDKLSKALGGRGKDANGARLIELLCILKPGKPPPAVGPAHKLLLDYNVQDVEELRDVVYPAVKGFGEPDVIRADRSINDRGIPIDTELLSALLEMYQENARRFGDEFSEATGGVNPKSPKQVLQYLSGLGFDVESVNKSAVHKMLSNPEDYYSGDGEMSDAFELLREAVELRRELAGVGRGKAEAAARYVDSDRRLRDQFVYYAAHTGRWTSRGLQLHNMPSVIKSIDVRTVEPVYSEVSKLAEEANIPVSDALNIMLRRLVKVDSLAVADYGAVEARCLAWMTDGGRMYDVYCDPSKSIYIDMGSKVFGRQISKKDDPAEYTLAKALVLGCGYGMSGKKFEITVQLRHSKDDLAVLERTGISAADAVKVYRSTYPEVPALWDRMHKAVHAAVGGSPQEAGRCILFMHSRDLHAVLPSGRVLVYRNARVELRVPAYVYMYNLPEEPVPTVVFDNPRGYTGFLYGSKLVENLDQAICRDLLAYALAETEREHSDVVLHVHDEIAREGERPELEELLLCMSTPPSWAPGFPLLVEGYTGPQWTKNTRDYTELVAMGGKLL